MLCPHMVMPTCEVFCKYWDISAAKCKWDKVVIMETRDRIIEILKEHEDSLSDGFGYYCDPKIELGKIADEILRKCF